MESNYNLELERLTKEIKKNKAKRVLVQLPDGLKPQSGAIVEHIESTTDAKAIIWMGSCFGSCDIPVGLEALEIDIIIQWGHNSFHKLKEGW